MLCAPTPLILHSLYVKYTSVSHSALPGQDSALFPSDCVAVWLSSRLPPIVMFVVEVCVD